MCKQTTYTQDQIAEAAAVAGIAWDRIRVLLQVLDGQRYQVSNGGNGEKAYDAMAQGLRRLHTALGSWQAVADELGLSKAYWWRVSKGYLAPSQDALLRWTNHLGENR